MTAPLATGTYALLRSNSTDAYGDDVDTNATTAVAGYTAMVGSVVEQDQDTRRRTDGASRDVRRYIGRFPAAVPVQEDDRIKDNATGEIYTVASWRTVANPITGPTLRLALVLTN